MFKKERGENSGEKIDIVHKRINFPILNMKL